MEGREIWQVLGSKDGRNDSGPWVENPRPVGRKSLSYHSDPPGPQTQTRGQEIPDPWVGNPFPTIRIPLAHRLRPVDRKSQTRG